MAAGCFPLCGAELKGPLRGPPARRGLKRLSALRPAVSSPRLPARGGKLLPTPDLPVSNPHLPAPPGLSSKKRAADRLYAGPRGDPCRGSLSPL